jgi:hypothetical protein
MLLRESQRKVKEKEQLLKANAEQMARDQETIAALKAELAAAKEAN